MGKTNIEWVKNSDGSQGQNWNPFYGCRRKSEGCVNCYAEQIAGRFSGTDKNGKVLPYAGIATKTNGQARWTGKVKLNEKILLAPLRNKKPTTYFVNSMSDTFYSEFPDEWIDKLFAVMALCPQHTFQVLTKRPERMKDYLHGNMGRVCFEARKISRNELVLCADYATQKQVGWIAYGGLPENHPNYKEQDKEIIMPFPFPNVWLGVSVENQKAADERIPLLLDTPAAVRWLSCEPLLEEIDLSNFKMYCSQHGLPENPMDCLGVAHDGTEWRKIDWAVVGGESGNGARPCNVDWIRSIANQCKSARVPVFVKQLGSFPMRKTETAFEQGFAGFVKKQGYSAAPEGFIELAISNKKGGDITEFPADLQIRQMPAGSLTRPTEAAEGKVI